MELSRLFSHIYLVLIKVTILVYFRGVSSVVRRCVHRHTGQELAVKIIEITAEKMTAQQLEEVKTSTLKEIHVLNMVKGHPSISMLDFSHLAC